MTSNDEPRIPLGKYKNGVLEIYEGFKKLEGEIMEGYENVRKVIFPASLEQLGEFVFSGTQELEELDFSRVTKLKEIPDNFVSCETKITQFIIPTGVEKVGDCFLCCAEDGTKVFVPASVKQMGCINGNCNNDLDVYLFTSGIDIDDFEPDVNTLYVLPSNFADYAEKLIDRDSEVKLREMPEELLDFYSNITAVVDLTAKPEPVAPAAAPIPVSEPVAQVEKAESQDVTQQQVTNTKNMGNNIIPQELEMLIQQYLTDGVLTDKERQVILKKAEGMGLYRDEIDLYLDAEVQKIDQATDAALRRQKGKTCPYCGAPIPQLTEKCPECGQIVTPEANDELKEIIDNLEEALVNLKEGDDYKRNKANVERFIRKAQLYYGNNPKIQKLLEEIKIETTEAIQKAKGVELKKNTANFISRNVNNIGCSTTLLLLFVLPVLCEYFKVNAELGEAFLYLIIFVGIIFLGKVFFDRIFRK